MVGEDDELTRRRRRRGGGGGGGITQGAKAAVEPAVSAAQLDGLEQAHALRGRLDTSLVKRVAAQLAARTADDGSVLPE